MDSTYSKAPAHRRSKPRLIVADPSKETRAMVRSALADAVTEAVEASDGRQLFWLLESLASCPQAQASHLLLVSDVLMGPYSGIEVLEAWTDANLSMTLVATSRSFDDGIRSRVARFGGILLPKPFTAQQLRATVHEVLP